MQTDAIRCVVVISAAPKVTRLHSRWSFREGPLQDVVYPSAVHPRTYAPCWSSLGKLQPPAWSLLAWRHCGSEPSADSV